MAWRTLYDSCISETNPDKLRKLVFQLEEAIVLRYHDLANQPTARKAHSSSDELQAIKRAAQQLLRLKVEKLGASAVALATPAAILGSFPSVSVPPFALQPAPSPVLSTIGVASAELPRRRLHVAWQRLVCRTQAAFLATQRAWQNWIFKSLK